MKYNHKKYKVGIAEPKGYVEVIGNEMVAKFGRRSKMSKNAFGNDMIEKIIATNRGFFHQKDDPINEKEDFSLTMDEGFLVVNTSDITTIKKEDSVTDQIKAFAALLGKPTVK